jgi:integrase
MQPPERDEMKFTDMAIKNLKQESKQYYKRESDGFAIRVLPSGVKTWLLIYTIAGKRRQMNLGEYPGVTLAGARDRLTDVRKVLKDGKDPQEVGFEWHKNPERDKREAEKQALIELSNPTVEMLINEFIEKHSMPNKRCWRDDKRLLEYDALPAWGNRKLKDIAKRDVVLLLESIIERGSPGSANNNFKLIRRMFNYAVEKDIIQYRDNPCVGVKMPAPLIKKDRVLNDEEMRLFWRNLETCNVSDELLRALRLILVTGQRPGEVIGMHSSEIDGNWWTIPIERSKNKKAHRIYLTDTAIKLIGQLEVFNNKTQEMEPKGYIFRCPHTSKNKPISNSVPAQVVRRNIAAPVMAEGKQVLDTEGNPVTENLLGVANFTPHDLRRTMATYLSKAKFMDEVIDAVLNHTKQGIIAVYNQNKYDDEKREALIEWEYNLKCILSDVAYRNPKQRREDQEKTAKEHSQNVIDLDARRTMKAA